MGKITTHLYVLTENEGGGGAPIAHGDRRTFTDGPVEIESKIAAKTTLSPGKLGEVTVTLDKESELLQIGKRLMVKQNGKLIALGVQTG